MPVVLHTSMSSSVSSMPKALHRPKTKRISKGRLTGVLFVRYWNGSDSRMSSGGVVGP